MRRVLFLDLDDTLFHSRRAATPGDNEAVADGSDGTPDSFMSPEQRAFFDWIVEGAEVVPTTGRNEAAFRRVRLPFSGWAICSFGGLMLRPDGSPEPRWRAQLAPLAELSVAPLQALVATARRAAGDIAVRARVIEDDGLPLYLSVKTDSQHDLSPVAAALRTELAPGWRIHVNRHNLAIMPPFLGKEHAVRWFIENVCGPDVLTIGAGDSLSDAPFLAACHYALMPAASQLLRSILAAP